MPVVPTRHPSSVSLVTQAAAVTVEVDTRAIVVSRVPAVGLALGSLARIVSRLRDLGPTLCRPRRFACMRERQRETEEKRRASRSRRHGS
jgi:hypothetical protein